MRNRRDEELKEGEAILRFFISSVYGLKHINDRPMLNRWDSNRLQINAPALANTHTNDFYLSLGLQYSTYWTANVAGTARVISLFICYGEY